MKICYYLCGVASALLLALPLHSATELGKLPLTTPMDTSAEVTQKIKDSSLKINGYDIEGNKLILSDKFINDIDKVYSDGGQYVITKLSDHPILYTSGYRYVGNNKYAVTNYVKPLYKYLTGERHYHHPYGDCFIRVGTNNPETAYYINSAGALTQLPGGLFAANKNSMPPEVKYLTIDDSMVKLNNILFNRSDLNIDGINVCTSNDIENVYTVTGFSDMIYTKTSDVLVHGYSSTHGCNVYYKSIYYYSTHERVKYGVNTNSYITVGHPGGLKYPRLIYFKDENTDRVKCEVYAVPTKVHIPLPIQSISIDTNSIYNNIYGSWSLVTNSTTIAIGKNANKDVRRNVFTHWIAIGSGSRAWNYYSVSVGNCSASSNNAVAVGGHAKTFNTNSVAMGYQSAASNAFSIAIGGNAISVEDRTTAIGAQSVANHTNATSVGSEVISHGVGTFNIYPDTMDKVYLKDNKLSDLVNTAITNQIANKVPSMIPPEKPEPTSLLTNKAMINIGKGAWGLSEGVSVGYHAGTGGYAAIAIGKNATVTNCRPYRAAGGIAIGNSALASNNFATAIGYYAMATDTNSTVIAVGNNAVNSHGMNTFTVGLTDNDPLNYFYLGNSSLKSLLTNYDNSKVTATSIGALSSSEDINLADGKSINLTGGDFTINCNEDDIYDSAITAGWDSSQKRMKISLMGPSTEVVEPTGVILESGNISGDGGKISVLGGTYDGGVIRVRGPNVDSGEIQYSAAAIIAECLIPNQSIYIKSGYQGPDNIVPAEINIGDCKIRESINKLTNDVAVVANNLTNSQNVVIGKNANINDSESYAIAVGRSARVIGYSKDNSIAIGSYSLCKSDIINNCNIAIGSSAVATNYSGVAIGNGATVSHADSISIGDGAKSHRDSTFNINFSDPAPGLHNVYINDNNLTTLFDKRMHDINEAWILKDPDGNTRLLMPNYNTIYQIYDSAATGGFNVIEYLDGYSDGYKFTWNSYSGEMTLKVANSTNILILNTAPTDSSITFIDSNNRKYTVTRKKSYEQQTYFDDKINILLTKIQEMETTISNLTQQVNALQNP